MAEDAGDEFTKTVKSIGNDLWMLFKTILEERRKREAQLALAAKEKAAEELAKKNRIEDQELMKSENEKMRAEMRDVLKANGMEVSDKNLTLAQESVDKMSDNQGKIDANDKRIDDIDNRLQEIDAELNPDENSLKPKPDQDKAKALQDEATKLKSEKAGLNEANSKLEAENTMLKNGRGLEQMKQDETVKNSLAKQMDQVNAGITRQKGHLDRCNDAIANIEKEQGNILDSAKPDMAKWEKLQANKETWQKEKTTAEQGIAKKEGQLNDLKQGKSLEQLERAAKLETGIAQGKQQIEGLDKVTKGYKTNQDALSEKQKALGQKRDELLKNGAKPEGEAVQGIQKEIRELELEKKGIQEKIDGIDKQKQGVKENIGKLEKDLDGVNQGQKGPEKSLGNKGPSQDVGGGERSWRPGSVGDQLQKQGYKVGQGPKQGQGLSLGSRR